MVMISVGFFSPFQKLHWVGYLNFKNKHIGFENYGITKKMTRVKGMLILTMKQQGCWWK